MPHRGDKLIVSFTTTKADLKRLDRVVRRLQRKNPRTSRSGTIVQAILQYLDRGNEATQ